MVILQSLKAFQASKKKKVQSLKAFQASKKKKGDAVVFTHQEKLGSAT